MPYQRLVVLPLVYLLLGCVFCPATWGAPRPNIIFVLADDLGYADVGFNGQQLIQTPQLDQMAREGMVFTQHYAGSTVCMPSRCTLMTGKHTGQATVRENPRWTASGKPVNIGPEDVTVAQELKRAGYQTAILGKWGLAEGGDDLGLPTRCGFDYFYGYRTHGAAHHYYPTELWRNEQAFELPQNHTKKKQGDYTHDLVTQEALQWLGERNEEPFFLYLAYTVPHYELTVPEDSKQPYQNQGWPNRKLGRGHYYHDKDTNVAYAGMVSRLDRDMGRLVALLKEKNLAENTLVIFSSDNGPEFEKKDALFNSNGPYRGGKRDLYEGGVRVPFLAWWPGQISAGSTSDHISAFWDFLPTACELAGVEPTDAKINGISYAPTLLGQPEKQQTADYLYWEFNEWEGPLQAIRQQNWKAVQRYEQPLELYDLSQDPSETTDIAAQHPEIVARMEQLLTEARVDHAEFPLVPKKKN